MRLVLLELNLSILHACWYFDNGGTCKINDILIEHSGTLPSCLKVMGCIVGGLHHFSVSPSPFGLGLGLKVLGPALDNIDSNLSVTKKKQLKIYFLES